MTAPVLAWRARLTSPAEFSDEFDASEFSTVLNSLLRPATRDLDNDTDPYHGLIVNRIALTERGSDPVFHALEPKRATVELANVDGELTTLFNNGIRGATIAIDRVGLDDSYLATRFVGTISQPSLADTLTVEAADLKQSVLEDEIPKGTITEELFPGAVDVGEPLLVVFGNALNVPLFCIRDDKVSSVFYYLAPRAIGDGALTFNLLKRDGVGGQEFAIVHGPGHATPEYEVLTGLPEYPSWCTVISFFERQHRFQSDELHKIYCDLSTPAADRNFSRVRRRVLDTAWGLSQPINAASFDAAEALVDPTTTNLYADGVLGLDGPIQARDALRLLGMAADQWLTMNEAGEWVENVDVYTPSVQLTLRDGPTEGVRNIVGPVTRTERATDDLINEVVLTFRPKFGGGYQLEVRRAITLPTLAATHGKALTLEHPYVTNSITAGKIAYRRAARIRWTDTGLTIAGLQDARALQYGDIISVTYAPRGLSAAILEIFEVTDELTQVNLVAYGGDQALYDAIYAEDTGALPSEGTINPIVDYSRTLSDPATNLEVFGETLRRNAAGDDVVDVTLSFDLPTVNISGYVALYRVTGTSEWIALGLSPQSGVGILATVPGLVTAEFYDFGIRTVNATGNLTTEPSISNEDLILGYQVAADTTAPATPAGFVAVPGTGSAVELRWTKATESDYNETYIFRNTVNSFPATVAAAITAGLLKIRQSGDHATDFDVTQGTQYWYAAAHADRSQNFSALCAADDATPTGTAQGTTPSTPSAPTFSSSGTYQASDGHTEAFGIFTRAAMPANAAILETIVRVTGSGGGWVVIDSSAVGGGTMRQDGGVPGLSYDIAHRAFNAFGKPSAVSSVLVFVAPGDTSAPGTPTSLVVKNKNGKTITFGWTMPADLDLAEPEYQVRSLSSSANASGAGTLLANGKAGKKATEVTVNLESLTYATTYHFRVRAKDNTGNPTTADGAGALWAATISFTLVRLTGGNIDNTGNGIDTENVVPGAIEGMATTSLSAAGYSNSTTTFIDVITVTLTTTGKRVRLSGSGVFGLQNTSGGTDHHGCLFSYRLVRDSTVLRTLIDGSDLIQAGTVDPQSVAWYIPDVSATAGAHTWRLQAARNTANTTVLADLFDITVEEDLTA